MLQPGLPSAVRLFYFINVIWQVVETLRLLDALLSEKCRDDGCFRSICKQTEKLLDPDFSLRIMRSSLGDEPGESPEKIIFEGA